MWSANGGGGGNVTGSAYALTVFASIIAGHEAELRETIESLPRGDASPLARLGQVHTSRLQIFDRLVYQGSPQKRDNLVSSYLVFTASFDGSLDPFLEALSDVLGATADSWWRHCVAYPGTRDLAAFKAWIRHNQIDTSLFAVASPNETVASVRAALALRERVVAFAIAAQDMNERELQENFRRAFEEAK